jgi:hypothetical protein
MATVQALNTISGKVGPVPESYLSHPVLGKHLVLAEPGQKDYTPELFKPDTAEGHSKKQSRKKEPVMIVALDADETEPEDTQESETL